MVDHKSLLGLALLVAIVAVGASCNKGTDTASKEAVTPKKVNKRFGMVIGLKDDQISEYKRLHAGPNVRHLLNKYHLNNYNIFIQKMPDGKTYEFAYYEYTGDDYEGDMAKLDAEKENIEWHKLCDPMQFPLVPGEPTKWTEMEQVYFNE